MKMTGVLPDAFASSICALLLAAMVAMVFPSASRLVLRRHARPSTADRARLRSRVTIRAVRRRTAPRPRSTQRQMCPGRLPDRARSQPRTQSSTRVQAGFDRPDTGGDQQPRRRRRPVAIDKRQRDVHVQDERRTDERPEEHGDDGDETPARLGTLSAAERAVGADPGHRQREHRGGQVGYGQSCARSSSARPWPGEHDDQRITHSRNRRGVLRRTPGSSRRSGAAPGRQSPRRRDGLGDGRSATIRPPTTDPASRTRPTPRVRLRWRSPLPRPRRSRGRRRCPSCWRRRRGPGGDS